MPLLETRFWAKESEKKNTAGSLCIYKTTLGDYSITPILNWAHVRFLVFGGKLH